MIDNNTAPQRQDMTTCLYLTFFYSRGSCEENERRGAAAIGNSIVAIATPITF
jgi:hypothetical protein